MPARSQVTNEAWEDAFVGAANRLNHQIQAIAAAAKKARARGEGGDPGGGGAAGSCVVVHGDGLVLTAHHVVEGAKTVTVHLLDGRKLAATPLQSDPSTDLSVLRVREGNLAYLSLAPIRSAQLGQYVFTIGYPALSVLGPEPKFTEGSISALSGPQGIASLLQISVPIQPGNSGGPLVNEAGELVGIVTSTASVANFIRATGTLPQNVNWAVKSEYARALFDLPVLLPRSSDRQHAIERARRAACLVEAVR